MSHVYYQEIDDLIKANKMYRFESELKKLEESKDNNKERIDMLNKIIEQEKSIKSQKQIKEDNFNHHIQILKNSQYQKKWQYLNDGQKLNRLDEFITRNNITDEKIISKLKKRVNSTSFKTKHISYNQLKGIIDDIPILSNDSDKSVDDEKIADRKKKRVRRIVKE